MDAGDLTARLVACHVKVVDHHVEEDAAADGDVCRRWGSRVAAGDLDDVHIPDLPLLNQVAHSLEVVVEAAVEAQLQLHRVLFCHLDRLQPLCHREVDGLLTEDVLAGTGRGHGVVGVGIGGGADEDRIDGGIVDQIHRIGCDLLDAQGARPLLDALIDDDVADAGDADRRYEPGDVVGVELADPSCSDDADRYDVFHCVPLLVTMYS